MEPSGQLAWGLVCRAPHPLSTPSGLGHRPALSAIVARRKPSGKAVVREATRLRMEMSSWPAGCPLNCAWPAPHCEAPCKKQARPVYPCGAQFSHLTIISLGSAAMPGAFPSPACPPRLLWSPSPQDGGTLNPWLLAVLSQEWVEGTLSQASEVGHDTAVECLYCTWCPLELTGYLRGRAAGLNFLRCSTLPSPA